MDKFELDEHLKTIEIVVDSREQENKRLRTRLQQFSYPSIRQKLNYGDYSIRSDCLDLTNKVMVERKKDFDELAMCFGRERGRFEREIKGAYDNGYTIYLLVENANWQILYNDMAYKTYVRSQLPRQSIIASLRAWQARYGWHIEFCPEELGGWVIQEILYRELKERLENDKFD